MEFEFDQVTQARAMVDIPDIGDFGLEAYNDNNQYYYLFVKTVLGETFIATCGYVIPDTDIITADFNINISHSQFNSKKISKFIFSFLNDYRKCLTGVRLMTSEEVIDYFKNPQQMLRNIIQGMV